MLRDESVRSSTEATGVLSPVEAEKRLRLMGNASSSAQLASKDHDEATELSTLASWAAMRSEMTWTESIKDLVSLDCLIAACADDFSDNLI